MFPIAVSVLSSSLNINLYSKYFCNNIIDFLINKNKCILKICKSIDFYEFNASNYNYLF
jgi:hypothetical protein